jgi:hypothetical protein
MLSNIFGNGEPNDFRSKITPIINGILQRENPPAKQWVALIKSVPQNASRAAMIERRITNAWSDASKGHFGAAAIDLRAAERDEKGDSGGRQGRRVG